MTVQEALNLLIQVSQQYQGNREDHKMLIQAEDTLKDFVEKSKVKEFPQAGE